MAVSALLLIDVQKAFIEQEALGARRNNPDAEANIARLLAGFRQAGLPVVHIHHASAEPHSLFRPGHPGFAVQEFARPFKGEAVITKHVNSAFIGTTLEADLRAAGIGRLIICGATTNHCVETSTRMAGNLGFEAELVRDACWAYDRTGIDGQIDRAEDIHAMTLSNLHREFATIRRTADILALLPSPKKSGP